MLTKSTSRVATLLLCLVIFLTLSPQRASADNEQLWVALKHGGKVILLRHTHVNIREGIGRLSPGNCAEEVNLRLGEAFRAQGVAIGEVLTSPCCRCIDTGRLAFGRATPVQYLRPPGTVSEDQAKLNQQRVVQEILKHRDPSNLVMITHYLNIAEVVLEDTVAMGEFFVVQPKGTDFSVLGKIELNKDQ